jgi:hypothetical protein
MQLGGTIFLVAYAFFAITPLLLPGGTDGPTTWWGLSFAAAGAVRSGFHRAAGKALVYGAPGGPLGPTRAYIAVSVAHTLVAAFALYKLFAPMTEWDASIRAPLVPFIAMSLAWPAALAVVVTRPRYKALIDDVLPRAEDLGYEGIAVLMTLMGAAGLALGSLMLVAFVKAVGVPFASAAAVFTCIILGVLIVRSFLHVKAGLTGVSGADPHTFDQRAQTYLHMGVASSLVTGGAMLLMAFTGRVHLIETLWIGLIVYLLLIWPVMLKRFFLERNFDVLMAGDSAPVLRRAPDAGLTALGWLLVATSVTALATELASLVMPRADGSQGLLFAMDLAGELEPGGMERWLPLIGSGLQLWAGIELVRMSELHRTAATAFGLFGVVSTVILHWDIFKSFDAFGDTIARSGANPFGGSVGVLLPIVAALVVPVATLLLVNRRNIAAARVVRKSPA